MTKYKKAILEIINSSYSHLTADEVYKELRKTMPKVVLATIYNNLNALVDEELIRRVSMEGQVDRYDSIRQHDHLVCKKCGKLIDIDFDDLTKTLVKKSGVKILGYDLRAFIICDDCSKKGDK